MWLNFVKEWTAFSENRAQSRNVLYPKRQEGNQILGLHFFSDAQPCLHYARNFTTDKNLYATTHLKCAPS